jgi:hypothetical protein
VLTEPSGFEAVGRKWRLLEERADLSFFQSWTWVGCQVEARFPHPILLQAGPDEAPMALALLNRVPSFWPSELLLLGESGDATLDAVFTEYNGPLLAHGKEGILPECLGALLGMPMASRRHAWGRRLRLSGVNDAVLRAARAVGVVRALQSRPAPFVNFTTLGADEEAFLATLSANSRYQLRRSIRRYQAIGPLAIRRARSVAEGLEFLASLVLFHQASWRARGRLGAFANPAFLRFHQELLARALPRGEADLLCVTAGQEVLGYLYNFVFRGCASSYQSGFNYTAAGPHQKPGMTSHYMAIAMYRRLGLSSYDFLAGDDRYKLSLSNCSSMLHWFDLIPHGFRWRLGLRGYSGNATSSE